MKKLIITITISTFLFLLTSNVKAASTCHLIYGGGIKDNCLEMQKKTAQQPKFPVYPPQNVATSPATGAESLVAVSLIPLATLGFLIRKKAIKLI